MPHIIEITDLSAPELAPYTRLTEAQLRNKLEPEKGIFIAESPKVIGTALDAGCEPLSFLMERRQIDGPAAGVLARCPDAAVYTADRSVLQALTGYALTRGVLCAMRRPQPRSVEALCRDARRVAVLEGIVDSTNIGAIFRGAAALGMDAVLLSPSCLRPALPPCRPRKQWARCSRCRGQRWVTALPTGPRPGWLACTRLALKLPPWRWTTAPSASMTPRCAPRRALPSCWAQRATAWPAPRLPTVTTPL